MLRATAGKRFAATYKLRTGEKVGKAIKLSATRYGLFLTFCHGDGV